MDYLALPDSKTSDDTIVWSRTQLVADDTVVAQVTLHEAPLIPALEGQRKAGYLTNLLTLTEFRRRGYGIKLVDAVTQFLHDERNLRYVIAYAENPESRALFERAGYWQTFVKNKFGDIAMIHGEPKPAQGTHWEPRQ